MAFTHFEPFGSEIEDERAGMIAALLYAANKTPEAKSMNALDFFPRGDPVEKTPEEMSEEELEVHKEKFLMQWPGYAEARLAKLAAEGGDAA